MTAPTMTHDWYSRGNAPFPNTTSLFHQAASFYWMFKAMLKGEVTTGTTASVVSNVVGNVARPINTYWTCEGSSDGVTAGMDGVDRWGSSYDSTKLVHGAGAHSWLVLKSPVALGPIYCCLNWGVAELFTDVSTPFSFGITFSYFPYGGITTSPNYRPWGAGVPTLWTAGTTYNGGYVRNSNNISYQNVSPGVSVNEPVSFANGITDLPGTCVWDAYLGPFDKEWSPYQVVQTFESAAPIYLHSNGYQNYSAHFAINENGGFHFATSRATQGNFNAYLFCEASLDSGGGCHVYSGIHSTNQAWPARGAPSYPALTSGIRGMTYNGFRHSSQVADTCSKSFVYPMAGSLPRDNMSDLYRFVRIHLWDTATHFRIDTTFNFTAWRGHLPDMYVLGKATPGMCYPATTAATHHVVGDVLVPFAVPPKL